MHCEKVNQKNFAKGFSLFIFLFPTLWINSFALCIECEIFRGGEGFGVCVRLLGRLPDGRIKPPAGGRSGRGGAAGEPNFIGSRNSEEIPRDISLNSDEKRKSQRLLSGDGPRLYIGWGGGGGACILSAAGDSRGAPRGVAIGAGVCAFRSLLIFFCKKK